MRKGILNGANQGDVLHTQKDMLMAVLGAILALVSSMKTHDKWIKSISEK